MNKKRTEKQLPATPDNAKNKSRQVKKKNGDSTGDSDRGQK